MTNFFNKCIPIDIFVWFYVLYLLPLPIQWMSLSSTACYCFFKHSTFNIQSKLNYPTIRPYIRKISYDLLILIPDYLSVFFFPFPLSLSLHRSLDRSFSFCYKKNNKFVGVGWSLLELDGVDVGWNKGIRFIRTEVTEWMSISLCLSLSVCVCCLWKFLISFRFNSIRFYFIFFRFSDSDRFSSRASRVNREFKMILLYSPLWHFLSLLI